MKGRCFIDTNVLIYCYSSTEPEKRRKAIEVAASKNAFVSTQVLNELSNILSKKFHLDWDAIEITLNEVLNNFKLLINETLTTRNAIYIARRYGFSYYDSLIIASALEAKCDILYTEDLHHNQLIEGKLRIFNPFL